MAASGDPTAARVDSKMESTLAEGQALINQGRYARALRVVVEAVNMCSCEPAGGGKTRHGKEKSCHISQCVAAVRHKDPDALYQAAQVPCVCGYSWPACSRRLHMLALDALADCLEKGGQHVSAFSTALGMVRLDPASPVGYCRGARMLRYLLDGCSLSTNSAVHRAAVAILMGDGNPAPATGLRQLLALFVESGIHNTGRYRHSPKTTYDVVLQRMASNLNIKAARRDPVKEFPAEVTSMVFALLDVTTLSRSLRVSKQWYRALNRDNAAWADLRFGRPGNPGRFFAKFLQNHQGIKSLIIRDATEFLITEPKLGLILEGLPQLKRLCLNSGRSHPHQLSVWSPSSLNESKGAPATRAKLTHLSAISLHAIHPLRAIMECNVATLQALDLVNTGGNSVIDLFLDAVFPSLKRLRVINGDVRPGPAEMPWIELEPIVAATPNLERFHLDGFSVCWFISVNPILPPLLVKEEGWRSLRKLVLGPNLCYATPRGVAPWKIRLLPPLPSGLQSLEILGSDPEIVHNLFFVADGQADPNPAPGGWGPPWQELPDQNLSNLEVFRCLPSMPDPRLWKHVLRPAVQSGALKVLELAISAYSGFDMLPRPVTNEWTHADLVPATDLAFAHSDNLHTLALHDFNFDHEVSRFGGSRFNGQPFLDWLECFPKLHTVGVYPGDWEAVPAFIMKLILHPRVKVIHQDNLRGANWDEARELAKKHGVELHHSSRHMPAGWPMIHEE